MSDRRTAAAGDRPGNGAGAGRARVLAVTALVVAINVAHYVTPAHHGFHYYHEIYQVLSYVPIILAGFWFGVRGGLLTSIVTTLLFAVHVRLQWGGSFGGPNLYKSLTIVLYNAIGWFAGFLSDKERHARHLVEESYERLKEQSQALIHAEEQLRRADRLSALGELSAGLAHEIRNPLGSIQGTAEILADKIPPHQEEHEFAKILLKEVRRLRVVVGRSLDFARPHAPETAACDVNEALGSVLALTETERERAGVRLLDRRAPDLPPISFDPDQLRQIFLNLVLNAVQAMPGGGEVTVETRHDSDVVSCAVTDTGEGVPGENRGRIFDPFFTTKAGGTGLGLSIVAKSLERHGATIRVEGGPGRGATFRILFRAGAPPGTEGAPS